MTGSFDRGASTSPDAATRAVAVLGCGNMGSAMVRAFLSKGWSVTAWNRTPERAEALARDGAVAVSSAREALTSTPLAILCISSTEDVRALLDVVDSAELGATTVLNTTSGTPEDGRALGEWAHAKDVRYLDAAIAAYPEHLGTAEARFLVAGDEDVWKAHQDAVLGLAGGSLHVGTDFGAANAIDCAMTGAFYITTLTAFVEAARFTTAFGVSHEILSDLTSYSLSVMDGQLKLILDRLRDQEFATDQATLAVYADAAAAFAAGLNQHGKAPMIQATSEVLRRGVDAGLGDQDIAVVATLDS
ncbi:NAD(P)-dependent oxidoreductase [Marmoricola sp. URHB0036]|uniref:NAD(P)-dependent oxidoreductase n=1 Tax=Marmoricola sp. URHB0036 TaxID=1298863 RepID=UPI00041EAA59|nr:NAD(P)-binding domain-containing protein [Marmoricola sp. URHB0036]